MLQNFKVEDGSIAVNFKIERGRFGMHLIYPHIQDLLFLPDNIDLGYMRLGEDGRLRCLHRAYIDCDYGARPGSPYISLCSGNITVCRSAGISRGPDSSRPENSPGNMKELVNLVEECHSVIQELEQDVNKGVISVYRIVPDINDFTTPGERIEQIPENLLTIIKRASNCNWISELFHITFES